MTQQPPKILVFSDFDGTISTQDTGTVIIDHCMGYDARRALDRQILDGTASFRDAVEFMWDSVNITWEEALTLVKAISLDPRFGEFYRFCAENHIPLTVLSSGLHPLVAIFLKDFITTSDDDSGVLSILANDIVITEKEGKAVWKILYRDESSHGHDKSLSIQNYLDSLSTASTRDHHPLPPQQNPAKGPLIIFIGDGVSDISAARHADLVFAKRGKDLESWCKRENVPHIPWDDFGTVLDVLKQKTAELM
ncbi:hypothetical protein PhCBS80983_g05380 [Powellomyces hirtus]|uniref:Phosphoserine phosphatase n=1 Tax=Powellomyces hirtus TaxID=109895 RepID=A0A507DWM9_9FUNG|nr:hypothetical protein PhCBS80983_g05380 [Powellomyces hirtus]